MKRRKLNTPSGSSLESEPEEEITEESEMLDSLRENVCYLCEKPQGDCKHLLAAVDRTFGTIEYGSLAPFLAELQANLSERGESNALEVILEELYYLTSWVSSTEDDSGPAMSASQTSYFWGDSTKVEARLRSAISS